ncbi:TetR/AcrR family transcriptional regulator [Cellulomonas timonensis]|uniref:TetR/AcrR family transcriptional regulator n=1 Tax=Cellulomonas timonensis TaxID=1689271 RepID=UPI00082C37BE|nr:TetR/AcrR family transcriptional regulator [Cellulomonas timonensis]
MTTSGSAAPRPAHEQPAAPSEAPPTRGERQQQTRSALIDAARTVFARDGYHRARLEAIAHEAGYSKGAVYSNFDGKAALFLAVIDDDLARADAIGRESSAALPSDSAAASFIACADSETAGDDDPDMEERLKVAYGFSLASLEFIATAARDPDLTGELETRMRHMLTLYTGATLAHSPAVEDPLTVTDRTMLLAALEQGSALLSLSGIAPLPEELVREGMLRVLTPRPATTLDAEGPPA